MPRQQGSHSTNTQARRCGLLRRLRPVLMGVVLVGATFGAHFPAVFAGYVWDDDVFLTRNPLIRAEDGLYRFWFTTQATDYFPLTSTMLWLEWRIWGDHPLPYHVGNILLHAAASVLLWRVLRRLRLSESAAYLAAMIFAVHPVTVASVAWITERKNVLPMVLYLLSILAYLRFEEVGWRRWYAFAFLAATAALLAKPSVVMLPFVLLLLAWWKRGRIGGRDIAHILPFIVISVALGLVTVWFQLHNAIGEQNVHPEGLAARIAASGWIVWFYLYKLIVPIHLVMIYPRWHVDGGNVVSFIPLALLIGCFVVLWVYRRSWGRGPLVALGCFVIVLVPVLGFIDMAFMGYSLVSDHLQYTAMPGVIALLAGLLVAWTDRPSVRRFGSGRRVVAGATSGLLVLVLAVLTWRRAETFRNDELLWTQTIEFNSGSWAAWNNRGIAYSGRQAYDRAIQDFSKAIELDPRYAFPYSNRAVAYGKVGRHELAIADCTRAIELDPEYAEAYNNRANAFGGIGDYGRAVADFTKAIELKPDYAEAYDGRGNAFGAMGDYDRAIADLTRAIEYKSDYAQAYDARGNAYVWRRQYDQAVRDCTKAIELNPEFVRAYANRAAAYYHLKAYEKAWADVRMCRELGGTPNPDLVRALTRATGRTE